MNKPFLDHSWSKIFEKDALSKVVLDSKLKQLDEVAETLKKNSGAEAIENVLEYKLVKRALEQCRDYLAGSATSVTSEDYFIYADYAEHQLEEAQNIIDSELSHLGL